MSVKLGIDAIKYVLKKVLTKKGVEGIATIPGKAYDMRMKQLVDRMAFKMKELGYDINKVNEKEVQGLLDSAEALVKQKKPVIKRDRPSIRIMKNYERELTDIELAKEGYNLQEIGILKKARNVMKKEGQNPDDALPISHGRIDASTLLIVRLKNIQDLNHILLKIMHKKLLIFIPLKLKLKKNIKQEKNNELTSKIISEIS